MSQVRSPVRVMPPAASVSAACRRGRRACRSAATSLPVASTRPPPDSRAKVPSLKRVEFEIALFRSHRPRGSWTASGLAVLSPPGEIARYALAHDVAEAGAADLVIGQQPAVVDQREYRVGGWRILGIVPRLEIDHHGPDVVFILRRLSDVSREFSDVRTLA